MFRNLILFLLVEMAGVQAWAQFEEYFENKTMRFDFYHCGDRESEEYFLDEVIEEPYWAGSRISLTDTSGYGNQLFKIWDTKSGKLIYSRAYCTLFNEWQTTAEATKNRKCMPESVVFPFPKREVRIELLARNREGIFETKFQYTIQPGSYFIRKFIPVYETFEVLYTGDPAHRVDLVLLPEGYGAAEREKFKAACETFVQEFFRFSPYKEKINRFNVRAVWASSEESGVSIPGEHIWKHTVLKAGFYTFGSERYQMIEDFQHVRDLAAHVPYDYIYVLSNTQKYGGGGIFNFYGISAAHHPSQTGKIYVHEFGHVLLGLGDEYAGNVSYNEMYPQGVEPWEENLTTLTDFDRKMWKKMLDPATPVPTPVNEKQGRLLGVYEGGGYVDRGVFRPWQNCLMNNLHRTDEFCPVCSAAIVRYIDWLCQ